jgi:hypothetical protein
MRKLFVSIVLACLFVAVSAQDSHALLRWIHELSGPGPFWGVQLRLDCSAAGCVWPLQMTQDNERMRFVLDGSAVWGDNTVATGTATILSLEPGLEYWLFSNVGVGAALSYNRTLAVGSGPNRNKVGLSTRITFRSPQIAPGFVLDAGVQAVVLNKRFTREEFGGAAGPAFERVLWGFFVSPRF